ncbi:hypothetical protein V6N13_124754 [Hibiscus sabdariffa]|uniref:Uncharacterized protein n=1 Tax=Hibiscus sabdariffa TaxID=183260 RepID=A0ABR2U441_9ROSI
MIPVIVTVILALLTPTIDAIIKAHKWGFLSEAPGIICWRVAICLWKIGFDSEESPIEPSDGNKRSRKHYDLARPSLKEPEIVVEKIVSTDLIDQARREP